MLIVKGCCGSRRRVSDLERQADSQRSEKRRKEDMKARVDSRETRHTRSAHVGREREPQSEQRRQERKQEQRLKVARVTEIVRQTDTSLIESQSVSRQTRLSVKERPATLVKGGRKSPDLSLLLFARKETKKRKRDTRGTSSLCKTRTVKQGSKMETSCRLTRLSLGLYTSLRSPEHHVLAPFVVKRERKK